LRLTPLFPPPPALGPVALGRGFALRSATPRRPSSRGGAPLARMLSWILSLDTLGARSSAPLSASRGLSSRSFLCP